MSSQRVIKCPKCNQRHFISAPCGDSAGQKPKSGQSTVFSSLVVFIFTTLGLIAIALALATAKGPGWGIAIVAGVYLLLQLCRLGYDFDDGIDIHTLFLPAPFDWSVKWERFFNFWTMDRPWFRAACIGSWVAMVVVILILIGRVVVK